MMAVICKERETIKNINIYIYIYMYISEKWCKMDNLI